MIETVQDSTAGLPPLLQWVGVMLAGAIPFIESYFGSVIGILAGITPPVAIAAAVVGNVLSMGALVIGTAAARAKVVGEPKPLTPKRQRLRAAFDKYGVAGVSLLGQTILPSQITSAALVSFGASRNRVLLWQTVSIVLWGVLFGVLATVGVDLVGPRQ